MLKRIYYSLPQDLHRWLFSVLRRSEFNRWQSRRAIDTNRGFSFNSFEKYQCIFVHIPKAAGVSICRTLFGNLCGAHTPIRTYRIIFSKKEFNHYFKFSFVRNPWDRVFSSFNFLKNGGMNERDRRWEAANLYPYGTFEDFVKGWLNKSNIWKYVHFIPQYEFLCLPYSQKIYVEFLGYFENIQEDFQYIKNKLTLNSNLTLKHENATSHDKLDYKDFYTNEMHDIVAEIYEKDIELLGYNFDNSSLVSQLKSRST